jgi:diguanylate cyclase (GGDEF)-like protein
MIDNMTGFPDLASLLNWINDSSEQAFSHPISLMAIQLTALWQVNRFKGRKAGDELLKWFSNNLKENLPGPHFRAGGDKFVLLLDDSDFYCNMQKANLLARKIHPGNFDPSLWPLRIAVIHFSRIDEFSPGNFLACLFVALSDEYYAGTTGKPVEFYAGQIKAMEDYPWMMVDIAAQILRMGNKFDIVNHEAQTDLISQLPNIRAAEAECDISLTSAREKSEPLSVLMIDGDNLRKYNEVSFAEGDKAIQLIGSVLKQQMRETDFLARYRCGDEFLVLLKNTSAIEALQIAQRLCQAVEQSSQNWLFPTTISIGVAVYPEHGATIQDLLFETECCLEIAKKQGKNQAFIAELAITEAL